MDSKRRIIIICASIFVVLAVAVISISMLEDEESVKLMKDTMQMEAGEELEFQLSDYMEGSKEQLEEVKVDTSKVDTDKPGEYKIAMTYRDREFLILVSVRDTTPPVLQMSGETIEVNAGESIAIDDLGIQVVDFSACELTFSDGEKTKVFETAGEVKENIIAVDAYENKSETEISIFVLGVHVPEIYGEGLVSRTFYIEDGVDLLSGIAARDVEDGDLTAQIQVEAPDLTTPGSKKITYRVTDSDGHEVTRSIYLTAERRMEVLDKVMSVSQETIVYRAASEMSGQLGALQYGQEVHATGHDKASGWYRINYDNGIEGYVSGTALADIQTEWNVLPDESTGENDLDGAEFVLPWDTNYEQTAPTQQSDSAAEYSQFTQKTN